MRKGVRSALLHQSLGESCGPTEHGHAMNWLPPRTVHCSESLWRSAASCLLLRQLHELPSHCEVLPGASSCTTGKGIVTLSKRYLARCGVPGSLPRCIGRTTRLQKQKVSSVQCDTRSHSSDHPTATMAGFPSRCFVMKAAGLRQCGPPLYLDEVVRLPRIGRLEAIDSQSAWNPMARSSAVPVGGVCGRSMRGF